MTAHQKAEAEYKQGQLARNKYRYEPGTGTDPETGQMVHGMYRLPVLTDDPDADRKFFPNQTISGRTQRTMTPIEIDRLAQQKAALEVGVRPKPDDTAYIGKPAAYEQALKNYQIALNAAITKNRQDMRTRYGITNPGGAMPGAQQSTVAAPVPTAAVPTPAAPAAVPQKQTALPAGIPPGSISGMKGGVPVWKTPDGRYLPKVP